MILCLDSGNSRLKWALASADGQWQASGAVARAQLASDFSLPEGTITSIVGCNVAGDDARLQIENALRAQTALPVQWLQASAAVAGVRNHYVRPQQLGADRWAALLGAASLVASDVLVVMAGTATTVDMLRADGQCIGGIIIPGVDMMRSALAQNTAQLPLAESGYQPYPDNTDAAIIGGVLEAQAGAIERLFARLPSSKAVCLVGGGAAERITPLLNIPYRQVDDLVLRGLLRWAATLP